MHLIKLSNVWKVYQTGKFKTIALRNINLKIEEGESVAIIGPSGSGKSTLLHIIGCLDKPTRGKVLISNRDVSKLNDKELSEIRKRFIGFVFQFFYLVPCLTALENVALPMVFARINRKERIERAKKLLKLVGLERRMHHLPSELSGGERQRVAIARALANDPKVLLADEPTGNLDSKTGKKIIDLLFKLNKKGLTLIIVSHNPEIAERAERIIYLRDGSIIKEVGG